MTPYFPLFLSLEGRGIVVIGGGAVAVSAEYYGGFSGVTPKLVIVGRAGENYMGMSGVSFRGLLRSLSRFGCYR